MSSEWLPPLSGSKAGEALAVAREVGSRLADPNRFASATERAPLQSAYPEYTAWSPIGLAQGNAGLALTYGQLGKCFPGAGFESRAHAQVELAVEALRRERSAQSGLFSGLAGVAFAAETLDPARYRRLLGTLDGLLVQRAESASRRMDRRGQGVAEEDFDVVSGLAGIGAYFLARGDEAALRPVLARLVRMILVGEFRRPGWYTPAELLDEDSRPDYPRGRLNCGLAHGLPGPLALLSLAHSEGIEPAGLAEAITCAAAWLVDQHVDDEWGANWPSVVTLNPGEAPEPPARTAWCYGAPGIARSLWLAGATLGDPGLQELAVAALEAVQRRPPGKRRIDAPTFCHGASGLLQITLRIAHDSASPALRAAAADFAVELAGRFEPDSLLGYRDLDPDGRPVDQAGLLQGAAGVVLVLLAAAAPAPPLWDRMFLLS